MRQITLVIHNVRSIYNVGSLFRTADGLGVSQIILSGYTPYPAAPNDERPPYVRQKVSAQIHKTALGAEANISWQHTDDLSVALARLRQAGYQIVALEQTPQSVRLDKITPADKVALIVGSEVGGLDQAVLGQADRAVEIPMRGKKESFNVAVAAAIALYSLSKQ